MARALPVIATSSGGVYSVVTDEETGILVPPTDSVSLARRILELLRDPLRARAIGENAREMVRREFPVSRMIDGTLEVYHRVLNAWGRSATTA
jgi:glycosyltransferase involved in cell wall biosynthesis